MKVIIFWGLMKKNQIWHTSIKIFSQILIELWMICLFSVVNLLYHGIKSFEVLILHLCDSLQENWLP